jgi:acetyl-CoA C-acetyltransferase
MFEQTPAPMLGSVAVKAALQRAGVQGDGVDEVIFGNVIGAGLGQNVARQVSIRAGLSPSIGATSVNKVCGSGLKSVMLAAQAIQCGDAQVVVAGGTENMSRTPYLLEKARSGYRMGNGEIIDSLIRDGLWDVYNNMHMGTCGDRCAEKYGLSREQQDEFAVASFKRALRRHPAAHCTGNYAGGGEGWQGDRDHL